MPRFSIEFISVFGLPPVELVELAADLGFEHITAALERMDQLGRHERYSLRTDAALRRAMLSAMRERGVSLSLGEGIAVQPGADVRDLWPADLDIMQELGVPRINVVSLEPDQSRGADQLGRLTEMAAARGIETLLEFVPIFAIADLATAAAAVAHVGRPDCRLMIDTMHVGRSGASAADLAAIDPQLIGYIQLCDAPTVPTIPDYMEEAVFQRRIPGEGQLPLVEYLAALPLDRVIGLEVPLRDLALAGVGDHERMQRCLDAARRVVDAATVTA